MPLKLTKAALLFQKIISVQIELPKINVSPGLTTQNRKKHKNQETKPQILSIFLMLSMLKLNFQKNSRGGSKKLNKLTNITVRDHCFKNKNLYNIACEFDKFWLVYAAIPSRIL